MPRASRTLRAHHASRASQQGKKCAVHLERAADTKSTVPRERAWLKERTTHQERAST
jgi:hypothetical protein